MANNELFTVDADIIPLQNKFFESAEAIPDVAQRREAYEQVRNTFGSIQQARDILEEKRRAEEDRALNIDLKKASIERGNLELAEARDKVRQRQENLIGKASFNKERDAILNSGLPPEEIASQAYALGAKYYDLAESDPGVRFGIEALANSGKAAKAGKVAEMPASFWSDLGKSDPKTAEQIYPGASNDPRYQASYVANQQEAKLKGATRAETAALKQQQRLGTVVAKSNSVLEGTLKNYETETSFDTSAFGVIDTALGNLNKAGLIDDQDKQALREVGIYGLEPEKRTAKQIKSQVEKLKFPSGKPEEDAKPVDYKSSQVKTLRNIITKAALTANAKGLSNVATPSSGFDINAIGGEEIE